ncbi:MAG: hypothetical protein QG658_491 [Patescibacteria group bacterium]|nr:hypothetical protein [Patescibacteria group bacterium]
MIASTALTAADAEAAYHALKRWLKARGIDNWLDDVSLVWLDANAIQLYTRRNPAGSRHGIADADQHARSAMHLPGPYGVPIHEANHQPIGWVGIDTQLNSSEALLLTASLAVFTRDTSWEYSEFFQIIIEEFFIQLSYPLPELPRLPTASERISSQAGLAALMRGAALGDLLPCGQYGVPPLEPRQPPAPLPGVDLITHVPGFGGGIHN